MWIWGTLFELTRSAGRGLARLYIGAILLMFALAGLGAAISHSISANPEEAAALAVSAATDSDYGETRDWMSGRSNRRRDTVAAEWERDRREQEAEEAFNTDNGY